MWILEQKIELHVRDIIFWQHTFLIMSLFVSFLSTPILRKFFWGWLDFWRPCCIRGHKGQNSTPTRCRGFLVLQSRCRGFSALEPRCRGFLSSEKCVGITMPWVDCLRFSMSWLFRLGILMSCICASTASFSFSLNLLCHRINVDMWVVNCANCFVSHKLVFEINE